MGKRIVVLDDDADLLESITCVLQSPGWTVIPFRELSTPEDLVAARPDCLLIDEGLPGIKGHTICTILKSVYKEKCAPIILMSGCLDLEEKANLCAADAYLKKPFINNEELINIVSSIAS